MSSASLGSSSRCRIRRGDVIMVPLAAPTSFSLFPSHASWWGLIDDGPETPQLLDGVDELVEIDRLYHIGVHAILIARDQVSLLTGRREHYHRNHFQLLIGFHLPQHLQSIHLRQLEIKQHDRRVPILPRL